MYLNLKLESPSFGRRLKFIRHRLIHVGNATLTVLHAISVSKCINQFERRANLIDDRLTRVHDRVHGLPLSAPLPPPPPPVVSVRRKPAVKRVKKKPKPPQKKVKTTQPKLSSFFQPKKKK